MAQTITSAIAQLITLPTQYTLTVTDSGGVGRSVTIGTTSTNTYYRHIAPGSGAGTPSTDASAPKSFFGYLVSQLNTGLGGSLWNAGLDANGFAWLKWTGVTNPATITWPGDNVLRNLLGFTANISVPPNTTQTATYHPTHMLYAVSRANDTGWQIIQQKRATGRLPTGKIYSFGDLQQTMRRTFDLRAHPADWATRTALNAAATPYLGDSSRFWAPQVTSSPAVTLPWGLSDFFATCGGQSCGALLGTFQSALTGGTTTCDQVYVAEQTLNADAVQKLLQPNNSSFEEWPGVSMYRTAIETL